MHARKLKDSMAKKLDKDIRCHIVFIKKMSEIALHRVKTT